MLYPVAVLKGDAATAHGLFFPDVPGVASAVDELADLHTAAVEALDLHFSSLIEEGDRIPMPASFNDHADNPEYSGMMWAWVDIDVSRYDTRTHKINVTMPSYLVSKIDEKVSQHKALYKSRSNYLAQLAEKDLA